MEIARLPVLEKMMELSTPKPAYFLLLLSLLIYPQGGFADLQYTDVSAARGIGAFVMAPGKGGGVAAADYDNDGDIDLFLPTTEGTPNQLYVNDGSGNYTEIAASVGLDHTDRHRVAVWFDYTADGLLDLLVAGDCWVDSTFTDSPLGCPDDINSLVLYKQLSDGTFENTTDAAGMTNDGRGTRKTGHRGGFTVADVNNDGYLDVFIGIWNGDAVLYINNGDETFSEVGRESGVSPDYSFTWQPMAHDFDSNGCMDIYSTVDFRANNLWMNQGELSFIDGAPDSQSHNAWNDMGMTLGDYDQDGDFDIYITNIFTSQGRGNELFRNDSQGDELLFTRQAQTLGVKNGGWGWGCIFFDADNDTDLDLAATNGWFAPNVNHNSDPSVFFRNDMDGGDEPSFTEVGAAVGFGDTEWGSCVVAVDYDRDGDLDLIQTRNGSGSHPHSLKILESNASDDTANNWLCVRPRMTGSTNFHAIGAVVEIEVDGQIYKRLISAGTSFQGQEPAEAFFGLGDATVVDRVTVHWPNGNTTEVNDVASHQVLGMETLSFTNIADMLAEDLASTGTDILNESLAWGDYDNDDDDDLYLTINGTNRLYRNDGATSGGWAFTDVTHDTGVGSGEFGSGQFSVGTAFGDIDNDGDLDLYVTNFGTGPDNLFLNNGPSMNYSFTDIASSAGITIERSSRGMAFLDYNRDGYVDIFVNAIGDDILYRNNGDLTFTDVAMDVGITDIGGQGVGVVATDLDKNGWIDLFTGNRSDDPNRLYLNFEGEFTDVTTSAGITLTGFGMGVHAMDYDNDLDMDLYWTTWPNAQMSTAEPNALYENDGTGTSYTQVAGPTMTEDRPGWGISNNAADIDNDGWEDFYVTNGFDPTTGDNVLFHNQGDGTFADVTDAVGGGDFDGRGVAFADYDNDGDMDFVVTGGFRSGVSNDATEFWRNDSSNTNHWITLKLEGVQSNRSAFGARIEVTTDIRTTMKFVSSGEGRGSFNSLPVEFGLGQATEIQKIDIFWPSGITQTITNPAMDQILEVVEEIPQMDTITFTNIADMLAADIASSGTNILNESLAWGDYDNDDDEDLYLTIQGTNRLYRNDGQTTGGWTFTDVTHDTGVGSGEFGSGQFSVGTAFGDIDNDGDLDLYVTNFQAGPDNLFLNNGPTSPSMEYTFTDIASSAGITIERSSRGMAFLDYNRDGYVDIFVNAIGDDILYRNNGDLTFTDVAMDVGITDIGGQGVGVVATDVDKNGWIDLFTGNRSDDPNRLYLNFEGEFTDVTTAAGITLTGFGMGVHAMDYDNDLDMDLYWTTWPNSPGSLTEPNALYENDGTGASYMQVSGPTMTEDRPGWGISNNAGDIDNDGWEDFYVTNGFDPTTGDNVLFHNQGDGTFADITDAAGGGDFDGRGVAFADFDNDGDMDFVVTGGYRDDPTSPTGSLSDDATEFWRNDSLNANNWITLKLEGVQSNRSAFGARIEVTTDIRTTMKFVSSGEGRGSFNSLPVEFGLGQATEIQKIDIFWPSGITQTITSPPMNQILSVLEESPPAAYRVY
jgi:hypothetical protein